MSHDHPDVHRHPDAHGHIDAAVHPVAPGQPDEHGHAGEHELPHESLAPITLAAGVALLGFGFLTSPVFSVVGLGVIARALASWIEEIRHG